MTSNSNSVLPTTLNLMSRPTPNEVQTNVKYQEKNQIFEVLSKQRLQDLVHEVDPHVQNDDEVEELLLKLAEDFIDDIIDRSCFLAKHRKSITLEVKDVQLCLEKDWNMWIPGFGCEELRPYKKSALAEAHKQRMALIRKARK